MIVGNGLLASAFQCYVNRNDILIFASGVSNSLETRNEEFSRELNLVVEYQCKFKDSLFVYFGTCSIYDQDLSNSAYVRHKIMIEEIVKKNSQKYIIIRLPQVAGSKNNQSTILNYIYKNIVNGYCFDAWSEAIRYIVDIEDVVKFVNFVVDVKKKINIDVNFYVSPCKVMDIVSIFKKIFGDNIRCNIVKKGKFYSIPLIHDDLRAVDAGIVIDDNYTERVIRKYYSN